LGQRKGLGLGGEGEPWFVVGKNIAENELVVVRGSDHAALYTRDLVAGELNWFSGEAPPTGFECTAKTRYRQTDQECRITLLPNEKVRVDFKTPQRAVTPGQYVVFYQNEACLGGGVIESIGPSLHELGQTPGDPA
jgi:tRNA-specific 2-thiouridylase